MRSIRRSLVILTPAFPVARSAREPDRLPSLAEMPPLPGVGFASDVSAPQAKPGIDVAFPDAGAYARDILTHPQIRLVGATSQIVYRPLPVDDPKQRRPDITRARTILGWEPKVGLEEGLLKTVDYFKTKIA